MTDNNYSSNSRMRPNGHTYNEAIKRAMAEPTADMMKPHQIARASATYNLGIYNPVTCTWMVNPSRPSTAGPKDYSVDDGSRTSRKIIPAPGQSRLDPITQSGALAARVAPETERPATASKMDDTRRRDPGWHHSYDRGRGRPSTIDAHGDYNPVLGTWKARPTDARRENRETGFYKAFGSAKRHIAQTTISEKIGIYDPVKNMWIVPPKDKRVINGLTISARILGQK